MIQELKAKAAEHWRTYLPKKWAALVEADRVDLELKAAATEAERQIRMLMQRGARQDEAEEMVLPDLILLRPEVTQPDEDLAAEEEALEAEYQENVGRPNANWLQKVMEQDQIETEKRAKTGHI